MRYTLRQLSYFVAAGETGSVKRAAEQVHISQPSVSAAISHLESELNVQLFVRHHAQGLSLTPSGKRLLRTAKELLRDAYALYDVANSANTMVAGPINVGCFRTLSPLILPDLWKSFVANYPEAQMHVTEGSEAALMDGLRAAQIDIALTYAIHLTPDMEFLPLVELPTYVLLAADHPLATQSSVRLEDLASLPFVLLDLPLSREYFLGMFGRSGLTPHLVAETQSVDTLRSYVASGIGFSLMTARPRNTVASNGKPLTYVALEGDHPTMTVGLASLKELRRARIVDAFVAHCRDVITEGNIPGMLADVTASASPSR